MTLTNKTISTPMRSIWNSSVCCVHISPNASIFIRMKDKNKILSKFIFNTNIVRLFNDLRKSFAYGNSYFFSTHTQNKETQTTKTRNIQKHTVCSRSARYNRLHKHWRFMVKNKIRRRWPYGFIYYGFLLHHFVYTFAISFGWCFAFLFYGWIFNDFSKNDLYTKKNDHVHNGKISVQNNRRNWAVRR